VGGGLVGSWDRLAPGLARALQAGTPFPPELTIARFPDDAPLIGAVALAADAARPAAARPGPARPEAGPEAGPDMSTGRTPVTHPHHSPLRERLQT
jgi:hypothetical protein